MDGSVGNLWLWVGFHLFIFLMLAIDLGLAQKSPHAMGRKEALGWSLLWITLSLVFAGGVWMFLSHEAALEYLAGYLIEKSLSVDNLFVFMMIFTYFKVPEAWQHRVLFWGIFGALLMRAGMIAAGTALLLKFHWLIVVFGAFLVLTALKMLKGGDDDEDVNLDDKAVVKTFKRLVPMSGEYDGPRFTTIVDGARKATPLLLVLVTVEVSDVIFALDSIPAIFGVSRDPFIIYTSNIFAILGLRALYFLLAALMQGLRFLEPAVALVLLFIGGKMIASNWGIHLSTGVSLSIVGVLLAGGVAVSMLFPGEPLDESDEEREVAEADPH
jgi:tellurite resistance protein TerC